VTSGNPLICSKCLGQMEGPVILGDMDNPQEGYRCIECGECELV
jgi:hypothetical protein